jgi:hypothetical protein
MKTFSKLITNIILYIFFYLFQMFSLVLIIGYFIGFKPNPIIGLCGVLTLYTSYLVTRKVNKTDLFKKLFNNPNS